MATVIAANNERQNESSRPEREVHLMKSPPVLQSKAAAKTKSSGVTEAPRALGSGIE